MCGGGIYRKDARQVCVGEGGEYIGKMLDRCVGGRGIYRKDARQVCVGGEYIGKMLDRCVCGGDI